MKIKPQGKNSNNHRNECPYCGSDNILPYEDDSIKSSDLSVTMIITTALSIVALYLAFVVTSYLYFPVVVFIGIIISTRIINKKERGPGKRTDSGGGNYICLNCNNSFFKK